MNVINKIKSKKNKQYNSQLQIPSQHPPEQPQPELSQHVPTDNHKVILETRTYSNNSEKSRSFGQDLDEVTINEYYVRKDKKMQMMNRIQNSESFRQQDLKQCPYCLNVKKSYSIGDICLFEGEIIHRKHQRQVFRKKIKLSCSFDAIQFPESISKILLLNITMLTGQQGLFIAEDIVKIAEKGCNKR